MAHDENRLALETTRLAYERTMMAWIRTATSLITFGFSVYKFFQIDQAGAHSDRLVTPRGFGIVMISMGLFSLLLATIEHMASMRVLRKELPSAPRSLSALIAGLISVLGILALLAAVFRQ
jgi:inner membrane protein YidH